MAGIIVLLTRRLSARVFWFGLIGIATLLTCVAYFMQTRKEFMNGPLPTALLIFILPAAIAISIGRTVKKWPLVAILSSVVSFGVAYVFTFSWGVNAQWLGK